MFVKAFQIHDGCVVIINTDKIDTISYLNNNNTMVVDMHDGEVIHCHPIHNIESLLDVKNSHLTSKQYNRYNISTGTHENVFHIYDTSHYIDDLTMFKYSTQVTSCANCNRCSSARTSCLYEDEEIEVDYTSVCDMWTQRTTND